MRLVVFVSEGLCAGQADRLQAGLQVLRTLREGYQGIRQEAVEQERQGAIPPLDALSGFQLTA